MAWKTLHTHAYLKGLDEVMTNLNKEINNLTGEKSMKGLIMAVAQIRRSTEESPPLTPLDLGNLRASWFTITKNSNDIKSSGKAFKGPKKALISAGHMETISRAKGIVSSQSPLNLTIAFGYGAYYAAFVHEAMDKKFKRPGAGPKWLEEHIKRNTKQILAIIAKTMKV